MGECVQRHLADREGRAAEYAPHRAMAAFRRDHPPHDVAIDHDDESEPLSMTGRPGRCATHLKSPLEPAQSIARQAHLVSLIPSQGCALGARVRDQRISGQTHRRGAVCPPAGCPIGAGPRVAGHGHSTILAWPLPRLQPDGRTGPGAG